MVGGYLTTLLAIVIVALLFNAPAVDALRTYVVGVVLTIGLAALYLAWNVVTAPSRLDKALSGQVSSDRTTAAAALDAMRAERDEARLDLEERVAATAVTIDVRLGFPREVAVVDVSEEAIAAWLEAERQPLGNPPPPAPPVEPAREPSYLTAQKIMALASTRAMSAFVNPLESRSPDQFRDQVKKWMDEATEGADAELLRQAVVGHVAVVQVYARNYGRRHLSGVRTTLHLRTRGMARSFYSTDPSTQLPKKPRRWGDGGGRGLDIPFLNASQYRWDDHVIIREDDTEIVLVIGPDTIPPGDEEQVAVILLGLPRPPVGDVIEGTWRVTAAEGEDDADGVLRIPVSPTALDHAALAAARKSQGLG